MNLAKKAGSFLREGLTNSLTNLFISCDAMTSSPGLSKSSEPLPTDLILTLNSYSSPEGFLLEYRIKSSTEDLPKTSFTVINLPSTPLSKAPTFIGIMKEISVLYRRNPGNPASTKPTAKDSFGELISRTS